MASKYLKKHTIPDGFQEILTEFTKEILRNQPIDILDFSCEYFRCLQEGLLLDYPGKGENLPCDFKPTVPKIPERKRKIEITKEDELRYRKSLDKSKGVNAIDKDVKEEDEEAEKTERENKKNDENAEIEQPKEEKVEEQKKEENVEKVEKVEEEPKQEEKQEKVEEEKNDNEEQKEEVVEQKEEEKKEEGEEKKEDEKKEEKLEELPKVEEEKKPELPIKTEEASKLILETAPALTLSDFGERLYQNCIDFGEKEAVLAELEKEAPDEIGKYMTEVFTPNKEINELLSEMQIALSSFYSTDSETPFTESINTKIETLKQSLLKGIFDQDLLSLPIKDAISLFKQHPYYPRILMGYFVKMKTILEENNQYVDEFCYFLFNQKLKKIFDLPKPKELLNSHAYIRKYFIHNIELLQPEIYSLTLNCKQMSEDTFCKIYTGFSVRKRELCKNFFSLYYIDKPSKEFTRETNILEKCMFISSLPQILEKLNKIDENEKDSVIQTITDKIQTHFNTLWIFIARIISTPIELISTSFYQFLKFDVIEREIILKFLALQRDYEEIKIHLEEIEINPAHSESVSKLRSILHFVENCNECKPRYLTIFNKQKKDVPEEITNFYQKLITEEPTNEVELLSIFRQFDAFLKEGTFIYLKIENIIKENEKVTTFLEKLKIELDLFNSADFCQRVENLKENYTLDSNEFIDFINQFNEWKNDLHQKLKDFVKNEENQDELFKELSPCEKLTVINIIYINYNIEENEDSREFLKKNAVQTNVEGVEDWVNRVGNHLLKIIIGEEELEVGNQQENENVNGETENKEEGKIEKEEDEEKAEEKKEEKKEEQKEEQVPGGEQKLAEKQQEVEGEQKKDQVVEEEKKEEPVIEGEHANIEEEKKEVQNEEEEKKEQAVEEKKEEQKEENIQEGENVEKQNNDKMKEEEIEDKKNQENIQENLQEDLQKEESKHGDSMKDGSRHEESQKSIHSQQKSGSKPQSRHSEKKPESRPESKHSEKKQESRPESNHSRPESKHSEQKPVQESRPESKHSEKKPDSQPLSKHSEKKPESRSESGHKSVKAESKDDEPIKDEQKIEQKEKDVKKDVENKPELNQEPQE